VLDGASLGRALLEARQKYIQAAPTPLGPIDLKTLGQFVLLGDPSVQPVAPPPAQPAAKSVTAALAKSKLIQCRLTDARCSPCARRPL
jgi:hypothetical protein